MVKKRTQVTPGTTRNTVSKAEVEKFAAGADGYPDKTLDKNAKRDYRALNVSFNEYEWRKLEALAGKLDRSKLNTLRHAMLAMADQEDI